MSQVTRTDQADEDLVEILAYLGQHIPPAANRFAADVERACRLLAQLPEMGALCEELAPGLRRFPIGKYVLFYQPTDDAIVVIRVVHGSRDIPALFRP
jgi:toxin ParE1/3/4